MQEFSLLEVGADTLALEQGLGTFRSLTAPFEADSGSAAARAKTKIARYLRPQQQLPKRLLAKSLRSWPQSTSTVSSLISLESAPFPYEIDSGPDGALSFKLLDDSHEEKTAKNSTSLTRKPERLDLAVRGSNHSFPFSFGGFDVSSPTLQEADINVDFLSGLKEYKTTPPGFTRGIVFPDDEAAVSLNFRQLLLQDDAFAEEFFQEREVETVIEEPSPPAVSGVSEEPEAPVDPVDLLIPETPASFKKTLKEKHVRKTYAHMVDTSQDIADDVFKHYVPELAREFPFELDIFQKYAVMHLERGESVFVAAHTSAGKTVVAEYAIALAQKHMTRTIYTSPIKALSNQKFRDFRMTFGDSEVGLLTGDVQIRPESSCVIMTTEILRSMLYRGADMIRDVEFVIFDEVHYINDIERGVVWEEVIIMLPPHVNIILLSATVPNTFEFADWVGRTKKKEIHVISTQKRPVPLEHHLFISSVVPPKLFKVVNAQKQFLGDEFRKAWDALHPPRDEKKIAAKALADKKKGYAGAKPIAPVSKPGSGSGGYAKPDRNLYQTLIQLLDKLILLPVVVFVFSKKKCEENADTLGNADLVNANEKSEIHVFIERSLSRLKGTDKQLPQILRMKNMLSRGIGVHHGGLLPIVKELVEILFARNLIKVLFATETFAMGVNMPAKCVVFGSTRKHDGRQFRDLLPGEYTQMSGRAGRRGLDETGVVIIACSNDSDFPEAANLQHMLLGQPTKLESQFRLTYNMILNLLRVEAIKVEDMMKRSFMEDGAQRDAPKHELLIKEQEERLSKIPNLICQICSSDIDQLYEAMQEWLGLTREVMMVCLVQNPIHAKIMVAGRVLIVNDGPHKNCVAAVVRIVANIADVKSTERTFLCAVLTSSTQEATNDFTPLPIVQITCPGSKTATCALVPIRWSSVLSITNKKVHLDADAIVAASTDSTKLATLTEDLLKIATEHKQRPVQEFELESKIKDFDFRQSMTRRKHLRANMTRFQALHCSNFAAHYAHVYEVSKLRDTIAQLQYRISDKNLQFLPDYEQRIQVLKSLHFVEENGSVQLKGRVACEINSGNSLVLTELIMENVLTDSTPAEIASILSAFVFQEKTELPINQIVAALPSRLQEHVSSVYTISTNIAQVQMDVKLDVSIEDFLKATLNFGLAEVVYQWANGIEFKEITALTDVLEGSIVRTITRLDELCREVRDAARVIGNAPLYSKMEEVSASIKRDIVFAASLYI